MALPVRRSSSAGVSTPGHLTTESYLSDLLSFSLDRLKKEPELLKQDTQRLERQVLETSVTHYEAFLSADRCLTALQGSFDQLSRSLEEFRVALPNFVSACEDFAKGSAEAKQNWAENKKLLANREKVSSLLEIPKLMEACVRNGNIDEALDLQTYVQRLGVLHGDLAAVQSLLSASASVRDRIQSNLVERLRSGIQLPECLGVVGHLRRLGIYADRDLRVCFLLCREDWIESRVEELDLEQPFEYMKRLTDIHRLHLFDVVMQYKAIFPTEGTESDGGTLSEWALHRVRLYLEALDAALTKIRDGASLLSLLESAMYCGMSLGRVGLDFRPLLIGIFEPRILGLFKAKLDEAVEVFAAQLETHRWVGTVRDGSDVESNGVASDGAPPATLAQHLPLALFVNGFLSGLNELRHCAPVRGRRRVEQWTVEALEQIATRLVRYASTRPLDGGQRGIFFSVCRDVVHVLFPYIRTSLTAVFSDSAALDTTGVAQLLVDLDGYVDT